MVSSPSLPIPSGSSSLWRSQVLVYLFLAVAPHLGMVSSPSLYVTIVVAPHFDDSLSVPIVVVLTLVSQVLVYLFLLVAPHLGMVSSPSLSVTRVVAPHFGDSLSVPIVVAPHLGGLKSWSTCS